MKNLMVQKGLVCMTDAEFERLQSHLAISQAKLRELEEKIVSAEQRGYDRGVAWASGKLTVEGK